MWNCQTNGLLNGTTCCIYDGNPGGVKDKPDWGTLWRFGAETGVTFFGAGAAFFANCLKADLDLAACGDLSKVRALGSDRLADERGRASAGARGSLRGLAKSNGSAAQKNIWLVQHVGRNRLRRCVRRRQPRAAADPGRDAVPAARLRGRGVQ